MIDNIIQYIKENILKDSGADLKYIQMSSASGKAFNKGRIVIHFFRNNEAKPFILCKFAKAKDFEGSISEEYENTKKIYSSVEGVVPEPLALAEIDNRLVFFQSFAEGKIITNLMCESKFSPVYNKTEFDRQLSGYLEDFESITNKLDTLKSQGSLEEFCSETGSLFNKFIEYFQPNSLETAKLLESMDSFNKLFKADKVSKRMVHFDFTPFNVIKSKDSLSLIDFEFSKESTLGILEALRYAYYLYKQMYEIDEQRYTENMNYAFYLFLSDIEYSVTKRFSAILKKNYDIDLNNNSRKLLCLLLFVQNSVLQYESKDYRPKDFINENKRYVNYFSGFYSEAEIFRYENSTVTELQHFLAIKDSQLVECQNMLEKVLSQNSELNNKLNELNNRLNEINNKHNIKYQAFKFFK